MKKITKIRLLGVDLHHCRSYTDTQSIKLYDRTSVTGANGVGKTTVAHAVVYAFYGVNYYGQQDIGFLRSEQSDDIKIQVGFRDQDGDLHILSRTRNEDTTTLTFDSYTIRQADIDNMLCEKSVFLSMFNPLYLPSLPDKAARELVLKCLPTVLPEQVLNAMSEAYRGHLDGVVLTNPDEQLVSARAELKRVEENLQYLKGRIEEARKQKDNAGERLVEQKKELEELRAKYETLKARQYEGIDTDGLEMSCTLLEQQIDDHKGQVSRLEEKLRVTKGRTFQSRYTTALAEVNVQLASARNEFKDVRNKSASITPGFICPMCLTEVDDKRLPKVKKTFKDKLTALQTIGTSLLEKKEEIETLMEKEQAVFKQYQTEDINKLEDELATLQRQMETGPNHPSLSDKLEVVREELQFGNLTEQEVVNLSAYAADIQSLERSINDLENQNGKERLLDLINDQTELEDKYTKVRDQISSLQEYLAVRARLAVEPLVMPHTSVELFNVTLSGVVQNVFYFEYRGRKFGYLSPSEKIRAGIEIAGMMRSVTGMDIPLFIDEAQSLHEFSRTGPGNLSSFKGVSLPTQVMVCHCTAGESLTVMDMNGSVQLPMAS